MNPDGQGANKLATGGGSPGTPRWSPDNTKIAYELYQTGERCSIWVMNSDGSEQTRLLDNRTCDRPGLAAADAVGALLFRTRMGPSPLTIVHRGSR